MSVFKICDIVHDEGGEGVRMLSAGAGVSYTRKDFALDHDVRELAIDTWAELLKSPS